MNSDQGEIMAESSPFAGGTADISRNDQSGVPPF